MTDQKSKVGIIVSLMVVLAIVLALSAFFLPVFGERGVSEERAGVFLRKDENISVRYEDWDSAHMLGEKFTITFLIQYRDDKITPDPEFLRNASFTPFDLIGTDISHREVENGISEYEYKVEVVAIKAIAGKEYILNPILFKYETIFSGDKEFVDIAPVMSLQVGSYYGDNLENVFLRPSNTVFMSNAFQKSVLFGAVSFLTYVSVILLFYLWKKGFKPRIRRKKSPLEDITVVLSRFERTIKNNLSSEETRDRMHDLEAFSLRLAEEGFGIISPKDFWVNEDSSWTKLIGFLKKSYTKEGPTSEDIKQALLSFKKIQTSIPNKKRRIRRRER